MVEKKMDNPFAIRVTGLHVSVTKAMKEHLEEKLFKVDNFQDHISDVVATMDVQKFEHRVNIILKGKHHLKIKVEAHCRDMYSAMDKAVVKVRACLHRYKTRLNKKNLKGFSSVDMPVSIIKASAIDDINDAIDKENLRIEEEKFSLPKVLATEKRPLRNLTLEEALMKIEFSGDHFMIYKDEEDLKIKVIYSRADGQYGVIEPE